MGVQPLGAIIELPRQCDFEIDFDTYIGYTLVLDSDFESPYVSAPTTRAECGPNMAEPDGPVRERPAGRRRDAGREDRSR